MMMVVFFIGWRKFFETLYYPFHIYNQGKNEFLVYHIPSETSQKLKSNILSIGHQGQLLFEKVNPQNENLFIRDTHHSPPKELQIRAVHQPFDESQRQIVLEINSNEVKKIHFNEDKTLGFLSTVLGDLFIIDVETGNVNKYSLQQSFTSLKISNSGNTFIAKTPGPERPIFYGS